MSNIVNLKLGTETVTKILQDDVLKQIGNDIIKWHKVANDAGGYYCRGIFVQPCSNNSGYWWYWDLGCQSGIKDNGEWNQFGFIYDGDNKNITEGMTIPFSNPGNWATDNSGEYGWNFKIQIIATTPNEEDLILDKPITIQFVDDRFDNCRFITADGKSTISEDKRTITITKLSNGQNSIVQVSGATNWTKDELHEQLKDIIVNVHGLQRNVLLNVPTDWGSVEIWDAKVGEDVVYKKDRTVDNYLKEYGLYGEVQIDTDTNVASIGTQNKPDEEMYKYSSEVYIPKIIDLLEHYKTFIDKTDSLQFTFNVKQTNTEFWNIVKQCLAYKVKYISTDYKNKTGLLAESNIDGEATLNFVNNVQSFIAGDNALNNVLLTKINFVFDDNCRITSMNKLFNCARQLKEITTNKSFGGADFSGMVTNSPVALKNGQVDWSHKTGVSITINNQLIIVLASLTNYFLDGYVGTTIEQNGNDRYSNINLLTCAEYIQMFNGCSNISSIGPVLDFKFLIQNTTTFRGCDNITDIRIKNLNHCDWIFDNVERNGINGYLPNLDADSVEYLFEHLYDLTTNNPDLTYTGDNGDEYGQNPWVDHANLYCPQQWQDKITPLMVDNAQLKGWSIYINNILQ